MELFIQQITNVPIYLMVAFQTTARFNGSKIQNITIPDRPPIAAKSCKLGTVSYPCNWMQQEFPRKKDT